MKATLSVQLSVEEGRIWGRILINPRYPSKWGSRGFAYIWHPTELHGLQLVCTVYVSSLYCYWCTSHASHLVAPTLERDCG